MVFGNEIGSVGAQRSGNQISYEAHVGMLGDFCGGFENSLKSQANGAIQLANKLGAKIDETKLVPVDNAKFGTKEWGAQLAGEAAAISVELFAARKLGVGLQIAGRQENALLAAKATETAGTRIASSVALGAFLGGALTPTTNTENFWSDRLRNTVSGAISFGAMGGVSVGMEEASKLGTGMLSATLRNGYVNNAVGGFIGGLVGDVTRSALSGDMPTISNDYWRHVAQSGTEFALVGMGAHSLGHAADGVSSLGEQRPGTDRTNAKYFTDSIGLTKNPQTFNNQAEFKVLAGKSQLDRLTSEVGSGAEQSQADVTVKQKLHGVLGDLFGSQFRPLGDPKLMLLSHGTSLTAETAAKYDLIGTCSPLDASLQAKDVFRNRADSTDSSPAVWLKNSADDTFSLSRERQSASANGNVEPVMLGSIGRGPVEINGQPIRPGESLNHRQLEVARRPDGRLFARGKAESYGVWEKIKPGEKVVVDTNDELYRGRDPIAPGYLGSTSISSIQSYRYALYMPPGGEYTDPAGYTVGKNALDQLYIRDNNLQEGIFIRRAPGQWVELTTADQFIHLGPRGKVDIKFAPSPELAAGDTVRVNGKSLQSGSELTIGRSSDSDLRFQDTDLTVSRIHGVISRDSNGQIYVTDASSFGTYSKVAPKIRIPIEPPDRVGILSPSGQLEMYSVNTAVKPNTQTYLQAAGGNLKFEPVFVGRTPKGTLYLQDNTAGGAAWLQLPKQVATHVEANAELMLGVEGTRLKFDFTPPQVEQAGNNQIGRIQPIPVSIAQPGVSPILQRFVPPNKPQRIEPPEPKTPNDPPARPKLEWRTSPLSGIKFGYKIRDPFIPTEPAAIQKYNERLQKAADRSIHPGDWGDVRSKGTIVDKGSHSLLVFDDPRDARAAASFIEGIIHRKTKGTAEVGYGAEKVGNKFTPFISWDGLEGAVDLNPNTTFPKAVFGPQGARRIPF
jgi:FHA domain